MDKRTSKAIIKLAGNHLNLTIDEAARMPLVKLIDIIKKLSGSLVSQEAIKVLEKTLADQVAATPKKKRK